MKFVTFKDPEKKMKAGWLQENNEIVDMHATSEGKLPDNMLDFLKNHQFFMPIAKEIYDKQIKHCYTLEEIELLAPLPNPTSVRDFMAFELHIKNCSKRMDIEVASEWYEIPAFYFTNHLVISGTNQKIKRPRNCNMLDYELEIACIIGKEGRDIKSSEADDYIFGYTILNDWSARDLQSKEMKVGLGPAKGKDFATSIGPYLVSKDELDVYKNGERYDLEMTAKVNGKLLSKGNFKDIYYSFGDMIERASDGVTLYPGDIIGSGTVGTGCILELGTEVHRWLEPGDRVELEITGLGKLVNEVG